MDNQFDMTAYQIVILKFSDHNYIVLNYNIIIGRARDAYW